MKDSEFIQLLNLYLDHEISAADAARLEAEVQTKPARRKVYQQYCRMQKACKLLTVDFETDVSITETDKKVVAFDPDAAAAAVAQRRRVTGFYTAGGLIAAAACVALVFVNRANHASAPAAEAKNAAVATSFSAPPLPAKATTQTGTAVALGGEAQRSPATLVGDALLLTGNTQTNAVMASSGQDANHLDWINALQIAPLQPRVPADDLHFNVVPATLRPEARTLGNSRSPNERSVEMTAFRFQK